MGALVLIRGGGEIGSAVAMRLVRIGVYVLVTEIPQPRAMRRTTAFAEAVYARETLVEDMGGKILHDASDTPRLVAILTKQQVPVLVDGACACVPGLHPTVIVDTRMPERPPTRLRYVPRMYIGIGPGFEVGVNCEAAIGARAGFDLGHVYWKGGPPPEARRATHHLSLLRAPQHGQMVAHVCIGDKVTAGQVVAEVRDEQGACQTVCAVTDGVVWGLLHDGIWIESGAVIAEIAPPEYQDICHRLSEDALAIAGGVLEAMLSKEAVRRLVWA